MQKLELQPLIEALEAMLSAHTRLVGLCGDKSRAIMTNNTAALAEAVKQENRLMHESRVHDRKRGEIVSALAQVLDIAESDVTVSMLAQHADDSEREKLLAVQSELLHTLKTQKELNGKCAVLLKAHMEYAEMVLNLMVGDEDPLNNFYGSKGSGPKERRHTAGILDTKA